MPHLNTGYETAQRGPDSDEVYTPAYAVKPLLKYVEAFWHPMHETVIWCPFDEEDSEYVKVFRNEGYKVIATHIRNGQDFFIYEPNERYSFIISNPPFSKKDQVIKRLYELNKPYAILLPVPALQGQRRFPYMKDCEALIFDKRIQFYKDKQHNYINSSISFGTFYLCRNFLSEGLIFEELNRDDN